MLSVSSQFLTAIQEDGRHFNYALYVNGGSTDYADSVVSINIKAEACDGRNLSVGMFNKTQCTVTLYWNPDAVWAGSFLEPKMQVDGADDVIPLGKFWVYEDKLVGANKVELKCYDVPASMNNAFDIQSTSVSTIVSTIETQTGMYFVSKAPINLTTINEVPRNSTYASVLALIAGYSELSIRATRTGALEFYQFTPPVKPITDHNDNDLVDASNDPLLGMWPNEVDEYDDVYYVDRDQIYEDGYSADREPLTITSVTVSDGERTSTFGTGYGYTVANPYIDKAFIHYGYYLGATYLPMTFTFRGNPAIEIGDIIPVEKPDGTRAICYVMGLDFTIDGGFRMQVRCYADRSNARAGVSVSPTTVRIENAMSEVVQKLTDQTQLLAGGFGGFAKWHYLADGTPSELLFMDQPNEADASFILCINKNGIGFSRDGGQTYVMGWTIDGELNADFIKVGILSDRAGVNSWNMDTGDLTTKILHITELMQVNAGIGSYFRMPISADGEEYLEIKNTSPQFTMLMHTSWGGDYYVTIDPQNGFVITDGDFTSKVAPDLISARANLLGISAEIKYDEIKVENTQNGKYSVIKPDSIQTNGTKNRVVDGKLFYCYETPEPYFGDIGEARVGSNEEVIISIDPSFRSAIQTPYQVFLQPYGRGQVYVHERADDHFTVRGDAGTAFGWEIKAKQFDYNGGAV